MVINIFLPKHFKIIFKLCTRIILLIEFNIVACARVNNKYYMSACECNINQIHSVRKYNFQSISNNTNKICYAKSIP